MQIFKEVQKLTVLIRRRRYEMLLLMMMMMMMEYHNAIFQISEGYRLVIGPSLLPVRWQRPPCSDTKHNSRPLLSSSQ